MEGRIETRSVSELLADVERRRRCQDKVQFRLDSTSSYSSRDVYLAACESIAGYFVDAFDFKYAKSGPHARRAHNGFTLEISFQSDIHNIAGEYVAVWIHAYVRSAKLRKWRVARSLSCTSDYVAGAQIGNLRTPTTWLTFDFGDRSKRSAMAVQAIRMIEALALPFFARFENLPALTSLLVHEDLPGMSIENAIDLLMWLGDTQTARLAAVKFLTRHPNIVTDYLAQYQQIAKRGLSFGRDSGYARDLAEASHVFEFGNLTN